MRRRAAIKVLRPELVKEEQAIHRFFNEARATNEIRHPGIVQIYDCGTREDGSPWLIMELLEGETLSHRIARLGRLASAEVIELGGQAASVLEAAHGAGIVHRDLKPDNLFVIPDPERESVERVKVLDFGIAKLSRMSTAGSMRTQTGTLMGTPLYMSPEQCRGTKQIDARSDIYSLGLILYQMVAGELPFVSEGIGELFDMQMNRPPPRLEERVPAMNLALAHTIHRTLEKNPTDRFQSMAELEGALADAGDPAAAGRAPSVSMSGRHGGKPSSRTMALPTGSTTLSASVLETERIVPPRSFPVLPVAIAAVAVVAGGAFLALRSSTPPEPAPVAAPPPAAAVPAPAPRAAPPGPKPEVAEPAPVAAAEATVVVDIKTTPSEARVVEAAGGGLVGTTPLRQSMPRKSGDLELRIEKEGFLPKTVVVPQSRDFHGSFKLDRPAGREKHEPREPNAPPSATPERVIKL
jgi:serine/threonine-protein kinase